MEKLSSKSDYWFIGREICKNDDDEKFVLKGRF